MPQLDLAERCDKALRTDGLFGCLWELAHRWAAPYPAWFRPFVEHEAAATSLRFFAPLLVPGLLQTEAYARALFAAWQSADTEEDLGRLVTARMERQQILARDKPPQLWCVLDEGVLRRNIGGRGVMRDQLRQLAEAASRPKITIQVIPFEAGAHVGLMGAFVIAAFDGVPGIVYLETAAEGQVVEKPATVADVTLTFDTLRSEALPRAASRDLILKVAEGQWT